MLLICLFQLLFAFSSVGKVLEMIMFCCKRTAFASYDSGTYVLFVLIYLAQTLCLMFFRKVVYTMKLMDAR